MADAGPGAVAAGIVDDPQLAIDHGQRALRAVGHAQAAAVALLFVDFDDVSQGAGGHVFLRGEPEHGWIEWVSP